ncbi:Coenzyme F420 hydrogenase/dehydrogenase, beta subunit C-terminal domain [Dyadobacter sp. LHD-138]|uniref:Coenzyme F420 hydrogenase/dehydrogenase, beta subunit C-terminal domain n=1 Tax=Dyadobacter sp. LHD-138 TaxID=3071413 RepID=UPI0027DF5E27|nr:Coenzyme F420 hydrogenase/dehydrogenase, beta subunit C-terminal domain [Dyadobacter sp. LHD-138]MDQ6481560.1 Coenzyme F420 hydrogenase/dehydrogenase, beta subunit C-terminal domain [Dyadobacter sp. LHD-138]
MSIEKVLKNDLCVGCGLCESVFESKVQIRLDEKGFLRPMQLNSLTDQETSQLNTFCPGVTIKNDIPKEIGNISHPIWGEYNQIVTGYAEDKKIREQGSSGGVLTALASYLIESGEVDIVLHAGQSTTTPILTEYKISSSRENAMNNAGSRYAPSATLINLDEILDTFSSIAIIAKPCEIAAVRKYQQLFPEKGKGIKYLLSFFCAGVPSMKGTEASIKSLGADPKNLSSLRYRGEGWPGYFKITDKEGKEFKMTYNDSWGNILNRHLQFRCKICPDGTGEQADIVCADAWEESEDGYPSFEQRPGQSLIMTRTLKGKQLYSKAINEKYVSISDSNFDINTLEKIQPYQFLRKANIIPRILAMKLFFRLTPSYEWSILNKASKQVSMFQKVKNFMGTVKRL